MNGHAVIAVGITLATFWLLAKSRYPAHFVLMGALLLLSLSGLLTPEEALAGFSNAGLITVAAMLIMAEGLQQSGSIDRLVHRCLGQPETHRSALWRVILPGVSLSGFMNNTPVVATLIPAISRWARQLGVAPSRLLIPLSYGAILGGTLTMVGTSTNLVVNGQYQSLTEEPGLSLFAITPIGLPVAIVGVLYMLWAFPRQLPHRDLQTSFDNVQEFTLEVRVDPDGPLVGKQVADAGLRNLKNLYLVEIEREGRIVTAVPSQERLCGGDRLVFAGAADAIPELLRVHGLVPSDSSAALSEPHAERRLVQAVVSGNCSAIGHTVRGNKFREQYGAVVLAVGRDGQRVDGNLGNTRIMAGDTLLLEARPAFVSRQKYSKDFLLIDDLEQSRPNHKNANLAWGILLGVIVLAASGWVSMLNAALAGAGLMVVTGCLTLSQAEKSLDLSVLVTIGAAFALGTALEKAGIANWFAEGVLTIGGTHAFLLLALTYLAVSIMTETITNNAAAMIMLPIVLAIADQAGLPAEPFVFAIIMAASASFATPLGYQTNLMVYGPGGYRYADFLRVGIPMNLVIGLTTLMVIGWYFPAVAFWG